MHLSGCRREQEAAEQCVVSKVGIDQNDPIDINLRWKTSLNFHNSEAGSLALTASGTPSIEGRVAETGDGTVILDRVPVVTPSGDVVVPSLVWRQL